MTTQEELDELYPEHVKLREVHEQSQAVGEFVDWLGEEKNIVLTTYSDEGEMGYEGLYPTHLSLQSLLKEFFEIDGKKVEAEKRAMLESLQQ